MNEALSAEVGSVCCEPLDIVMGRCASSNRRVGIVKELLVSTNGPPKERMAVVLHFPPLKRGSKDKLERASYAVVNYCPFCGKEISK